MELDKYLQKHKLNMKCSKKDKISAITVNVLKQESVEKQKKVMKHVSVQLQEDDNLEDRTVSGDSDEDNGNDDDDSDLVFKDFDEQSNELSPQEGLIVTTRSGQSPGKLENPESRILIIN